MRKLIAMAVLAALVPACKASVNVNAKATADEPEEILPAEPQARAEEVTAPQHVAGTDYFGIARGLSLGPGQPAVCACVAAAVGYPGNQEFRWRGVPPKVGEDALVVAIGTDGITCDKPGAGPSIRGVDRHGDDVIVVLEEWHQARPQALGAIIPNPGANGHVYLRAQGKAPYGAPLTAGAGRHKNWCKIGTGTGTANTAVSPSTNQEQEVVDTRP